MPYVTGGYGNGGFDFENRIPATGGAAGATQVQESAQTRVGGWYVGGGVDWAISPGRPAGRHYEFDSRNATAYCGSTGGVAGVSCNPGIGTPMESANFDATDTLSRRA